MKKLICNVLAYLFFINPLMAATTPLQSQSLAVGGNLDENSQPLSIVQVKEKIAQSGLNKTELAEVNSYIDFAIENKIDPQQAKTELAAILKNVNHTGASLDSDVLAGLGIGLIVVGLIALLVSGDSSGSSSYWTCYADSGSYSAIGTGSTKYSAQNNALAKCASNSYYWETCVSYLDECY